jgi:hypothetical protein
VTDVPKVASSTLFGKFIALSQVIFYRSVMKDATMLSKFFVLLLEVRFSMSA